MRNTAHFFESLFNNARLNAMLIMNEEGIIKKANDAFTSAYGYTNEDLDSKHFRMLFIEKDQLTRKPELDSSFRVGITKRITAFRCPK